MACASTAGRRLPREGDPSAGEGAMLPGSGKGKAQSSPRGRFSSGRCGSSLPSSLLRCKGPAAASLSQLTAALGMWREGRGKPGWRPPPREEPFVPGGRPRASKETLQPGLVLLKRCAPRIKCSGRLYQIHLGHSTSRPASRNETCPDVREPRHHRSPNPFALSSAFTSVAGAVIIKTQARNSKPPHRTALVARCVSFRKWLSHESQSLPWLHLIIHPPPPPRACASVCPSVCS